MPADTLDFSAQGELVEETPDFSQQGELVAEAPSERNVIERFQADTARPPRNADELAARNFAARTSFARQLGVPVAPEGISGQAPITTAGGTTITPAQGQLGLPTVRTPPEAGLGEKIAAGVYNTGAGIVNFPLSPEGFATMLAPELLPGKFVGPAIKGTFLGLTAKGLGQQAGTASVTKDPQDITEAIGSAAMLGLIGKAKTEVPPEVTRAEPILPRAAQAAKEAIAETPQPETEVSDASKEQETAAVHGPMRSQSEPGAGQVPAEVGGAGVLAPAEAAQGEVPLKRYASVTEAQPDTVTVKPGEEAPLRFLSVQPGAPHIGWYEATKPFVSGDGGLYYPNEKGVVKINSNQVKTSGFKIPAAELEKFKAAGGVEKKGAVPAVPETKPIEEVKAVEKAKEEEKRVLSARDQLYAEAQAGLAKVQAEYPPVYKEIVSASGLSRKELDALLIPHPEEVRHPSEVANLANDLARNAPGGRMNKLYDLLAGKDQTGRFFWSGTAEKPTISFEPDVAGAKPDAQAARKAFKAVNAIRSVFGYEPLPDFFGQSGAEVVPKLAREGGEPAPQPEMAFAAGPGAATRAAIPKESDIGAFETNIPPLEKLADAVAKFPVQKGGGWREKLKQWMDEVGIPAKDFAARALTETKAQSAKLVDAFTTLPKVTDLERRVGRWDAADQEGGLAAHRFAQAVRARFKNRAKLRALSNWINAGGDMELLKRQMEATENPALKKTYEDALNFSEPEQRLAADIRQYHDEMLAWGQRAGALEQGVENYIHRYYPRESDPVRQKMESALQYLRFTRDFAGFKKRFYETDFDAEQAGKNPEKDAARRILAYDVGFRRALTARAFVKDSYEAKMPDGRPELDVVGGGVKLNPEEGKGAYLIKPKWRQDSGEPADYRGDYVSFDHPAFRKWKFASIDDNGKPILVEGEILVHPDAAKKYAALFEKSWWSKGPVRRGALGLSSLVKQTMLDISGFHPAQIAIHAAEHKVNPFRLQDLNPADPAQRELMEGGLTVADTKGAQSFSEGVFGTGLTQKIPVLGEQLKLVQDWLFKDFIPRIKMTMALKAMERNTQAYAKDLAAGKITREQLVRLTARESNAAFGEQNYRALFRHPSYQDSLRMAFLAPDFGEARIRFPLQALGKYGHEQRMALIIGAVGMFTLAKLIEKSLTGEVHWKRPFTVTYEGREYGLRNVASDLYHLISDPQSYIRNRLNPIYTRPILEFVSGRDAFGRKRTKTQQLLDEAKQVLPISTRGFVEKSQTWWESFLNAIGITEHRRTDFGETMKKINAWKEQKGYTQPGEFVYDPDKDPYHPLTQELSLGSDARAVRELNRLLEGKTPVERLKVLDHYRRSLAPAKPLTGSRAHEAEYLKGLSAADRQGYEEAKKERQQMWQRFNRVWQQKQPMAKPVVP